jgi:hypothetical protein
MFSYGYIKAICYSCNKDFRLIVDESILDTIP